MTSIRIDEVLPLGHERGEDGKLRRPRPLLIDAKLPEHTTILDLMAAFRRGRYTIVDVDAERRRAEEISKAALARAARSKGSKAQDSAKV